MSRSTNSWSPCLTCLVRPGRGFIRTAPLLDPPNAGARPFDTSGRAVSLNRRSLVGGLFALSGMQVAAQGTPVSRLPPPIPAYPSRSGHRVKPTSMVQRPPSLGQEAERGAVARGLGHCDIVRWPASGAGALAIADESRSICVPMRSSPTAPVTSAMSSTVPLGLAIGLQGHEPGVGSTSKLSSVSVNVRRHLLRNPTPSIPRFSLPGAHHRVHPRG
jgi:hypothetical protein